MTTELKQLVTDGQSFIATFAAWTPKNQRDWFARAVKGDRADYSTVEFSTVGWADEPFARKIDALELAVERGYGTVQTAD